MELYDVAKRYERSMSNFALLKLVTDCYVVVVI